MLIVFPKSAFLANELAALQPLILGAQFFVIVFALLASVVKITVPALAACFFIRVHRLLLI
jgi:hypothetical protein